jgi:hypothetical protein
MTCLHGGDVSIIVGMMVVVVVVLALCPAIAIYMSAR